jgi:uncharacterized protein YggE
MSTLTLGVDEDLEAAIERLKEAFTNDPPAPVTRPRISVTGSAVRRRLPDRAVIEVGVEGDRADTATEARKNLAGRVEEMKGLVKGSDCRPAAPARCQKTSVGEGDEKEEWFTATTTVVLRLEPEDFLNALELLCQGFTLAAPTYEFDPPAPLGSDLHREAAADARSKLEATAKAAGFRLGEVVVANILDSDTGQEPSRRLLQAGMGIGVDDGKRWDLHSQFQNLSQNLELKFSLPWRSKDELSIIPAVPVVEHLDPEVDKKVIDFLKSEIPVQATTVKVDLAVEVLPLG